MHTEYKAKRRAARNGRLRWATTAMALACCGALLIAASTGASGATSYSTGGAGSTMKAAPNGSDSMMGSQSDATNHASMSMSSQTPAGMASQGPSYAAPPASSGPSASASLGHHKTISFTLNGAQVPGGGDPDGSATARLKLYDNGTVCVRTRWRNLDTVTGVHIHIGAAGTIGGHAVEFYNNSSFPGNQRVSTCVKVSKDTVAAILHNPDGYYLQAHSATYPAGAIRGQLSMANTFGLTFKKK
jgi:hypothetical protein